MLMWEQTIYVYIRWVKKWIFTVVCAIGFSFWSPILNALSITTKRTKNFRALTSNILQEERSIRQAPIWVTVIKWLKYPPHINSSNSGKQFNYSPTSLFICWIVFLNYVLMPLLSWMFSLFEFFSFLTSGEKQDFRYIIYQICKTFFWKRRLEEVAQRQENLFSISKRGFTPNKDVTWAWQTQKGIHCKDVWHFDGFVHFHRTILDRQRLFLCQFDNRQGTYSIKLPIWDVTHSNG